MILYPCPTSHQVIREALRIFSSWTREEVREGTCLYQVINPSPAGLARLRVVSFDRPTLNEDPSSIEINFEREKIADCKCGRGVVYAGVQLASLLRKGLLARGVPWGEGPVFITSDYIATFDRDDLRWHLRYGVFSFPAIISLPGIIEAPARPREYYLLRSQGVPEEMMPDSLKERYLATSDSRLSRVLAGVLLQAFFWYKTGDPFCQDPFCSLYNAHWQEELLRSQRDEPYILCHLHQHILEGGTSG